MTLEEFYDEFKETHTKHARFALRVSLDATTQRIRQVSTKRVACPIVAVCNWKHKTDYTNFDVQAAARVLNLSQSDATLIMAAADGRSGSHIRQRLLEIINS